MEPEKKRRGREPGKYKEFPFQRLVRMRQQDVDNLRRARELGGYGSEAETLREALRELVGRLEASP